MRATLLVLLLACGSPSEPGDGARALGMNDVTLLLPRPADPAAPVLLGIAGDGAPLVPRALYDELVVTPGDLAPKNGLPIAFGDYQVVAVRFDLCDRVALGPCPDDADGRLRLVLQPFYAAQGEIFAHDLALHAFYPIPAAELTAVVAELRALARLADTPPDAPLAVNPALSAAAPPVEYAPRLRALVSTYARAERLVKLTVFGQNAQSAAFAWIFRGVDLHAGGAARIAIPQINATQQAIQVAGGDTVYTTSPVADAPSGLALAMNGQLFAAASAAERLRALEALVEIQHPARHDAHDLQCVSCHVATFLTARRAAALGIDPATLAGRYESTRATAVDSIAARDGRVLRALGWAGTSPAISQRVAHDTAGVLDELEQRFPTARGE